MLVIMIKLCLGGIAPTFHCPILFQVISQLLTNSYYKPNVYLVGNFPIKVIKENNITINFVKPWYFKIRKENNIYFNHYQIAKNGGNKY